MSDNPLVTKEDIDHVEALLLHHVGIIPTAFVKMKEALVKEKKVILCDCGQIAGAFYCEKCITDEIEAAERRGA